MGSSVGRIKAYDADVGENAEMWYSILDGDGQDVFNVITDGTSQEGVITVKRVNSAYISCFIHYTGSKIPFSYSSFSPHARTEALRKVIL